MFLKEKMFGTTEVAILLTALLVMVFAGVHIAVALGMASVLGIYLMASNLLGALATLQFNNVIIVSNQDSEAWDALRICFLTTYGVRVTTPVFGFRLI